MRVPVPGDLTANIIFERSMRGRRGHRMLAVAAELIALMGVLAAIPAVAGDGDGSRGQVLVQKGTVALAVANQAGDSERFLKEIRVGALDHDITVLTNGDDESGVDINIEVVFTARTWPWQIPGRFGRILPFVGITTQGDGDTSDQLYGGLAWDGLPERRYLLRAGFGASLHDGNLDGGDGLELGQRILWLGTLEAGLRFMQHHSLSAYYQHSSNGPFIGKNDGINNAGIRYGFHF